MQLPRGVVVVLLGSVMLATCGSSFAAAPTRTNARAADRVILRYDTTVGHQTASVGGVTLERDGRAIYGVVPALSRALPDLTCIPEVNHGKGVQLNSATGWFQAWRSGGARSSCESRSAVYTVRFDHDQTPGGAIVTPLGTLRVGERWRATSSRLRDLVIFTNRGGAHAASYAVGHAENPCNLRQALPAHDYANLFMIYVESGKITSMIALTGSVYPIRCRNGQPVRPKR